MTRYTNFTDRERKQNHTAISLVRPLNLGPTKSRSAYGGNNETDDKNNKHDDLPYFLHSNLIEADFR